jgi:SAM-dependent methyltransferase
MLSIARKIYTGVRARLQSPVPGINLYQASVMGKAGLEIGGPSFPFRRLGPVPIYDQVGSLDNCDFSTDTVWANHAAKYVFSPRKAPGRTYICDGSNLTPVESQSYDFVLSSHNLEHFANPIRALREWLRVLRPGGSLILVLPFYLDTFDHRRSPTTVAHMVEDFESDLGEDDLTHLPEILEKHDLARDPAAGSAEAFERRGRDNFKNRCLHHHVFDESNSRDLLVATGFDVVLVERRYPFHLCLLARAR